MFIEKVLENVASRIKQWPVRSNRASDIGHPCLRYHVYQRTQWGQKALHDVNLELIFMMGNEIEKIVIRQLQDSGVQVVEQQRAFEWPEYQITGSIDGKIIANGKAYPFDVKSCSQWVFKAINSIDDLKNSKYLHLRKYPVQLNTYMLMDNVDEGLFFFKDKTSGQLKEIWMQLDYEMGEQTIRKCEAVNAFVAYGDTPDRIDFDEGICGQCPYAHICLPPTDGREVEIDTGELAEMLKTYYQLESAAKEYKDLNDEINKMVEGRSKLLAGDYFVTGKWIEKKTGYKYWKKSIVKV
jgi:Holliday junction resolvase-like predicted endonuclease